MKKMTKIIGVIAISVVMAFGFIGCGSDNNGQEETDPAKPQEKLINFGDGLKAKVTGNMTDSQWAIAIPKLTAALNTASTGGGQLEADCIEIFGGTVAPMPIVLEFTKAYDHYKLDYETGVIKFNTDFVINASASDLLTWVEVMVNAVNDREPEQAKAVPVRDDWFYSVRIRENPC